MGYKHLTREQRYTIEALLQTPMSLREIGEVIGVSAGTVSREIRRNCDRPFLFTITEGSTGAILFAGVFRGE